MGDYSTDHRSPWLDDNGFLHVRTGSKRRTRSALESDLRLAATLAADQQLKMIWDARGAGDVDANVWIPLIDGSGRSCGSRPFWSTMPRPAMRLRLPAKSMHSCFGAVLSAVSWEAVDWLDSFED